MNAIKLLLIMLIYGCRLFVVNASAALNVCTTVPDLGNLCEVIGKNQVNVTVFVKGPDDPHFLEARPSFIRALSKADLFVQIGMGLEVGWVPAIIKSSRNPKVQPGKIGLLDTSVVIQNRKFDFEGQADRSFGDVHSEGNPHYLLDPINGLHVSRLIRDKFIELDPDRRSFFENNWNRFTNELSTKLVGKLLSTKYDVSKLAFLYEHGKLNQFLRETGEIDHLGGWLGKLCEHKKIKVIGDHAMWNYFADRFRLEICGYLEPKPGMTPSTRHLMDIVNHTNNEPVSLILTTHYFQPKYARFVSSKTNVPTVMLAHQVGAYGAADTYLSMLDFNIQKIIDTISAK